MSAKSNTFYDAIIVGAGVIGASFALALAQKNNWKIALVEKNQALNDEKTKPELNIRATAIGLSSKKLLSEIGVWQHIEKQQLCAYEQMFVWDENSDGELNFVANDYGVEALGYIVDHFALQINLQEAIEKEHKVDCYYACHIESCDNNSDVVNVRVLQNGEAVDLRGQWMFAADGVNSMVRELAQIKTSQHDYHQEGIVAKIRTEQSHQNTAWQRFLSSGPLALLPLESGECSIVWSLPTQQAHELVQLSDADFVKRIESALQSRLGSVELSSQRHKFPLKSMRAKQYLKGSIVLLGDAAHGIHPMAGQGANLGFADIETLLTEIATLPADHPKLYRGLRRYERQQKLTNQTMDSFMTGLDEMFRSDNVLLNSLRRIGLQTINKHSSIKSIFAQQVLGKVH